MLFLSDFNFFCIRLPPSTDALVLGGGESGDWDPFKANKAFSAFEESLAHFLAASAFMIASITKSIRSGKLCTVRKQEHHDNVELALEIGLTNLL